MTDVASAGPPQEEIVLALEGDSAFASLMDALAPDEDSEPSAEGGDAAAAVTAGDGQPAAPAQGVVPTAGDPAAPGTGDAGEPAVPVAAAPAAAAADGAAVAPGVGTVDAASLGADWGRVLQGLEDSQDADLTQTAIAAIRTEYKGYLDRIDQPARALVGTEVPSITNPEQMEVLRDSQDAKDWQDAVKDALGKEVRDRVSRGRDDTRGMMDTLTQSVSLFQNNPDLIPGTTTFDAELAERFVELAAPYQLEIEGKLVGYNIPVQGMLSSLRTQLQASRAAAAAAKPAALAPAAQSAQQRRAAEQARTQQGQFQGDKPQAGIESKAGNSGEGAGEDFSALFGTIGLPNFRI